LLAIPYMAIRLDFGLCDGGNVKSYHWLNSYINVP
jgi:hypothetical protein